MISNLKYGFINTFMPFITLINDKIKETLIKAAFINPALTDPLSTGTVSSCILQRLEVRCYGIHPFIIN